MRNLVGAVGQISATGRAKAKKKKGDDKEPVENLAQSAIETVNTLAASIAKDKDEREYLSKQLAKADGDQKKAESALAEREAKATELDKELKKLRESEQKLAQSATELSRELLVTAKAVVTDADPKQAQKIQQTLSGFEKMDPVQALLTAVGVMPAMREQITNQILDVAELRATVAGADEQQKKQLAELRAEIEAQRNAADAAKADAKLAKAQQDVFVRKAAEASKAGEDAAAALKLAQEELRQAAAELEDYRARGTESSGASSKDNARLKEELAAEQQKREALESTLAELNERSEAGEARLRKQREELTKLVENRDEIILAKDRELDARGASKIDAKSLEAQIATLRNELSSAHDKLTEFKQLYGEHAGDVARSGDLAKELKNVQSERNTLRDKHSQIESELADAVAHSEELRASLEERRKELQGIRDKQTKELSAEREKANELREESRKLKEEVVGLRARVRRLSDNS
jgi:predicted  nucleic acid-binding Zn-ribbon protein